MYKAKDGFEFDSMEKAEEYDTGANVCFGGCRDINDAPDEACKTCIIANECMELCKSL